ncbi:hypothetical protein [Rhizobium sp. SSA_523]|uniref:hypothetical protein n=1 Tax=Rhizobium sp. SSA_523 TaxID=2952477 RepID=UPI002091C223|nr:hypothetical protein [Rhizobium sp. SSA_523]MCO5730055.1 hypothetical protein [Rhizobium sp. SSA_523]WKC25122.1 hypothetical protein QTJ18_14125 [Rhizobium sp. SSA_523]
MIGFINTHNQPVYINPAQVLYVTVYEAEVSIIALAVMSGNGKPVSIYVRGSVDEVQARLASRAAA